MKMHAEIAFTPAAFTSSTFAPAASRADAARDVLLRAGNWHESTWDLRRGLEVIEHMAPDLWLQDIVQVFSPA